MLKQLLTFIRGNGSLSFKGAEESVKEELHLAATVLLLNVAEVDNDHAPEETTRILSLLKKHFSLSEDESASLIEGADELRQNKERVTELLHSITTHCTAAQRETLFSIICSVVVADGRVDVEESRFLLALKDELLLTNEQMERAKGRAR